MKNFDATKVYKTVLDVWAEQKGLNMEFEVIKVGENNETQKNI